MREENDRLKHELELLRHENEAYRDTIRGLQELQEARSKARNESDLMAFLDKALASAIGSVHGSDGSLLMVDSDSGDLVFMQVRGAVSATLPGYRTARGEGIAGWVAEHGLPQIVNQPYFDARFLRRVDTYFQFVTQNLIAVPIKGNQGVLGVLEVLNKTDNQAFNAHDLEILTVIADLLTGAITRVDNATQDQEP